MNWTPRANLVVRPEMRLGIRDERRYADSTKNRQRLLALDVAWIYRSRQALRQTGHMHYLYFWGGLREFA